MLTFIGWYLGIATIAILPLDISMAANKVDAPEMEYALHIFWRMFYWLAFCYSFLLAPIAMHYEVSGEFDKSLRLKQALRTQAIIYGRYAVLGALFVIWLWFHGSIGGLSVRGFLMAMGSAFGLLQIIVFLGYGLVNVPRQLHLMDSREKRMEMALCRVDSCEDRLQQTRLTVDDLYQIALTLKNKNAVRDPELKSHLN